MGITLRLSCFQTTQIWLDEKPLTHFPRVKAQALLLYLAVEEDRPHRRDALAGLLWPDSPEARARRNLSQTLMELRRMLGDAGVERPNEPPFLLITNRTIALNTASDHWVDVAAFAEALANQDDAAAIDLYHGPFLADFSLPDSDLFEAWMLTRREQLHRRALDAFRGLSLATEAQGDLDAARQIVDRLLVLAPWQEEAHSQRMRLLALAGERTAALAQYDTLSQILLDELGVSPSAETDLLYDQILAGEIGPARPPVHAVRAVPTHNAPFQVTAPLPHFVGRATEMEQIRQLLQQPGTPVISLVGMGGLGKTALATQVAHAVRGDFADGVLWANPAISSVMDILDNWGKAYGYDFGGLSDRESRGAAVRGVLAEKSVLLVLDNVTSSAQVRPLLAGGERCPILLTTRDLDVAHALNAVVLPLGELSAESGRALLVNILGAARVGAEEAAATQICELLHYLPLAVEIAAQRLRSRGRMSLAQMAQRLHDTGQRLGLKISDQAVRTSFEVSWEALDTELQAFFPLLAVFEGRPFTVAALAHVAEMDPSDVEERLYGLNALSLVREDEAAYFRQHPLLADFAKEQLDSEPYHQQHVSIAEITGEKLLNPVYFYARLVDYYLGFVGENQQNYAVLEPEWGNISAAIGVGHRLEMWAQVLAFTDVLRQPWLTRARYGDARHAFALAHAAAEALEDHAAQAQNWLRWGEACLEQNDYAEAAQHLEKSRAYYQSRISVERGALDRVADVQDHLARIAIEQNRDDEADRLLRENLRMRAEANDSLGQASAQFQQARIHYARAEWAQAQELAEAALRIQREFADLLGTIRTARLLAQIVLQRGELTQALRYCQQAQSLSEQIQDESELAITLYTLTGILRQQGEYERAKASAERSRALLQRMGDMRTEGFLLYQLSDIERSLGNLDAAVELGRRSVTVARQLGDQRVLAYALLQLGDLYAAAQDAEQRLHCWTEAADLAQTLEHPPLRAACAERFASSAKNESPAE